MIRKVLLWPVESGSEPAVTTRGLVEEDMEVVADAIEAALIKRHGTGSWKSRLFNRKMPLYPGLMG